jgi:glucose dehydrogenase
VKRLALLALVVLAGVPAIASSGGATGDWSRFGYDAARHSSSPDTKITSQNVSKLTRARVGLDGTVDSSPIYLHAVTVRGATHDVFVITTTYGRTEALDANSGDVLWRFTPPSYGALATTYRITNATPAA